MNAHQKCKARAEQWERQHKFIDMGVVQEMPRIYSDEDKKLKDAIVTWFMDTEQYYEHFDIAKQDLLELVENWSEDWIKE